MSDSQVSDSQDSDSQIRDRLGTAGSHFSKLDKRSQAEAEHIQQKEI